MADDDHPSCGDHLRTSTDDATPRELPVCEHLHLVETCAECGRRWRETPTAIRDAYLDYLARGASPPAPRLVHRNDLLSDLDPIIEQDRKNRKRRRRASQQLSELRLTSRDRRAEKVRSATSRFRSCLLAELLLEESRTTVRDSPLEAESFASLVPLVLEWAMGNPDHAWSDGLCALAEALRANALRVAGRLPEAERVFDLLRHALVLRPVADAVIQGEIASLEASLRIDQRRVEEAEGLLRRADRAFGQARDYTGVAKTRIKLANLMQAWERPADALHLYRQADAALGASPPPRLVVSVAAGRATTLCDLDRPAEARRVLDTHLDAFEEDGAVHTGAALRFLEGRIALGLGDHTTAEESFETSAQVMAKLGRHYDATLAALYLAETYLAQGRMRALGRLATALVRDFDQREMPVEMRKAARLLARATAAQEVTTALLERLRRSVLRAGNDLG